MTERAIALDELEKKIDSAVSEVSAGERNLAAINMRVLRSLAEALVSAGIFPQERVVLDENPDHDKTIPLAAIEDVCCGQYERVYWSGEDGKLYLLRYYSSIGLAEPLIDFRDGERTEANVDQYLDLTRNVISLAQKLYTQERLS